MKTIKQKVNLTIKCTDNCVTNEFNKKKRHSELLPNTIRCIMCGPSNCGKTNIMLNLLEHPNGLKFENIYIYSKSLFQPKYVMLKKMLNSVKGIGYFAYSENEHVVPPNKAKRNSIFIFDDVACDKQNHMRSYFSMGRHYSVDSFYLCQT